MSKNIDIIRPEQITGCINIITSVVLARTEVQALVDSSLHLPELAKKIDHIDGRVIDLEFEPIFIHEHFDHRWEMVIPSEWHGHFHECVGRIGGIRILRKVLVTGILHKQIYYVNKDDIVKHVSEDVPFSKLVELTNPQPVLDEDEVSIRGLKPRIDVTWELIGASRLRQTGVIIARLKVVEERQVFVQLCPSPEVCPAGNLLMDPGLEQWAGNVPLFWGATNVARTTIVHSGSSAAELGVPTPTAQAAIFQTVNNRAAVAPGRFFKLTFWAREDVCVGNISNFTMNAEVLFFNQTGQQISSASQSFPSTAIPDTVYQQYTINTTAAPAGTTSVLVRISFLPGANNTNTLKIDDVDLECTGGF